MAFCCPGLRLKAQLLAPHSRIFCLISYQTGLSLCRLPRALNPANTAHVILLLVPKYTVTPLTKGTEQPHLPAGSHWSYWEPQLPRTPGKWLSPLGDQGSCHQPQQTHLRAAATEGDIHKANWDNLFDPRMLPRVWLLACRQIHPRLCALGPMTKKASDTLGCTGKSIYSTAGKGCCPSAQPCEPHLDPRQTRSSWSRAS